MLQIYNILKANIRELSSEEIIPGECCDENRRGPLSTVYTLCLVAMIAHCDTKCCGYFDPW